ncbi:nitroreductase family protein [Patescibacteria group bacterium]|nr:nitroreductase family protein [Patescibacteria group bacterium]
MCRNFDTEKAIPDDVMEKLIDAGKSAPSAGGLKDQRFKVVSDWETKNMLVEASLDQKQLADASAVIVVSSDLDVMGGKYGDRGEKLYAAQDCAASVQNILLACTALGLGACWIGAFDAESVKKILDLPDSYKTTILVAVGYEKL